MRTLLRPAGAMAAVVSWCLAAGVGCGGSVAPARPPGGGEGPRGTPLGPSYVRLPVPGDDEGLLGRVLPESGAAGGSVPLVASASGSVSLKILQRKRVSGWTAAVITVTDKRRGLPLGRLATESVARVSAEVIDSDMRATLELTEAEARRWTTRYNQHVMKRFVKEQQAEGPTALAPPPPFDPGLRLRLGALGGGLEGTF